MEDIPISKTDAARDQLAQIGINEQDVADAIAWARKKRESFGS